jgi:DNA primase
MQAFNAFTTSEVDGMIDRIVFPIRNLYGDTKAFVGRWIHSNADPKYLNYPSGITLPLYPSDPYILHDSIILVEGILDALNLIDKGLPNAVCAFGAHTLSERSIDKVLYFHILGVKKIYIMFDADETGKKAALSLEKALKPHFSVEIVELPDGRDPGSLDKKEVEFIWKHLYENRRSRKDQN